MVPANHLKKTAMTYAGMTLASIMVLTMLLTSKPSTNLISKGFNQENPVLTLHTIMSNCHFSYLDCHQKPHTASAALNLIGKSYDINPHLLAVIGKIQYHQDPTDQSTATTIAQKLKNTYKTYQGQTIPLVVNHPSLGMFQLDRVNQASYLVFRYFLESSFDKAAIEAALANPTPVDGQIQGFQETYTSLFHTNPLE